MNGFSVFNEMWKKLMTEKKHVNAVNGNVTFLLITC